MAYNLVMAYRRDSRPCPVCHQPLQIHQGRWRFERCSACHGAFVEERVLAEMVREMAEESGPPSFTARTHGPDRPCPACGERMAPVALDILPLERCPAHGIWFDRDELQQALHAAGRASTPPERQLTAVDVILGILDVASIIPW